MGLAPIFYGCLEWDAPMKSALDTAALIETTVTGMGYEFVDLERVGRGMLRLFIDREEGISVEDCALVSNQLTRVFQVEGVDYDRLEVSSPGLDRPLKKRSDFERFMGSEVKLKVRTPINGQRNFVGRIAGLKDDRVTLDVEGAPLELEWTQIERAHLVPEI
jgi:ribosome maturation factor RimP